ncbi:MAG TPA: hypothetical protein VM238_07015 [Phycisphaerae bacterium]|nr:hypothetical protein [Phycisphaerae bacterium]
MTIEKGAIPADSELAKDRFVKGYTRSVNADARTVTGVASTIELDRDGEIILPAAFAKDWTRFLGSSAPFLGQHTHRSADAGPTQIGWVMSGRISADQVECLFRYAMTAIADEWWRLASDPAGKGHAFSIGFLPTKWVSGTVGELLREFPEIAEPVRRAGLETADRLRVYVEIELLEISAVAVPSNRQSLQQLAAKFFGQADEAKAVDELKKLVGQAVAEQLADCPEIKALAELKEIPDQVDGILGRVLLAVNDALDLLKASAPDTINPSGDADGDLADPDDDGAESTAAEASLRAATAEAARACQKALSVFETHSDN